MRYTLNLATKTYLDHRLLNKYAYILIVLLLAILFYAVSTVATSYGDIQRLVHDISILQAGDGTTVAPPVAEIQKRKDLVRFYNDIIKRKTVNWLAGLNRLEEATPESVALISVVPDHKSGDWQLEVRARSFKAVRDYLEKLENTKGIDRVMLVSHQESSVDKGQGLQFVITCRLAP